MKVIEQEEKQFKPVSLVMETLKDLDEVQEGLYHYIDSKTCAERDCTKCKLQKIYLRYK